MSEQEYKGTSEHSVGAHASAAGSLGANASQKRTEERKKPKKLGPKADPSQLKKVQSQSRGRRGRGQSQPPSDTDSIYRSDVSQKPRRNRNRSQQKNETGDPLEVVDELDDTVDDIASGAGDMVQNTAGNAVGKTHEALGGLLNNKKGGTDEQLRLRLDINLDIEVQLKAKIHGDLTLGLLN